MRVIGVVAAIIFLATCVALAADDQSAPAKNPEKASVSAAPAVQAVTEAGKEATDVVKAGVERRNQRREAIAPAAAEVTKGAADTVTGVMDRRHARRQARREAIFGSGDKASETSAGK